MPAAASNCLGGRFWLKLAVFWRFEKSAHVMLSIPPQSFGLLLIASIFASILTILSFFDPLLACAFCPNRRLLLCATCTFKRPKNRKRAASGGPFDSAKVGQRPLLKALLPKVPAGGKAALLQQGFCLPETGEQRAGGVAVAGDTHPGIFAAHFL